MKNIRKLSYNRYEICMTAYSKLFVVRHRYYFQIVYPGGINNTLIMFRSIVYKELWKKIENNEFSKEYIRIQLYKDVKLSSKYKNIANSNSTFDCRILKLSEKDNVKFVKVVCLNTNNKLEEFEIKLHEIRSLRVLKNYEIERYSNNLSKLIKNYTK